MKKYVLISYSLIYKRYLKRNFYTRLYRYAPVTPDNTISHYRDIIALRSYDTTIGYHDKTSHKVYTWGYGYYSATTSKQITMYCHENDCTRVDIDEMTIDEFSKKYLKE